MKGANATFRVFDRRHGWTDVASITAGEARRLIATASGRGLCGMSRVNTSITREQAASILDASIANVHDDHAIHPLIARNILREFGKPRGGK